MRSLGHHCRGRGAQALEVPLRSAGQGGARNAKAQKHASTRTVDSDGDALGEDKAISADESRDLVEGVGLEELLSRLGGVGLDLLDIEAVGLRDGADGRRAGVALNRGDVSAAGRVRRRSKRAYQVFGAS